MITDVAAYTAQALPKWNPMNICSYHLQEAGATPEQELAYALATAIAVLDDLRAKVPAKDFPAMVGRISFFVNAGIRFVTEICKMRAFVEMWDDLCQTRYGITEERHRRFRYGVQVNSLGLTEQQPENNVARILIEMLAVTLSKNAPRPVDCCGKQHFVFQHAVIGQTHRHKHHVPPRRIIARYDIGKQAQFGRTDPAIQTQTTFGEDRLRGALCRGHLHVTGQNLAIQRVF